MTHIRVNVAGMAVYVRTEAEYEHLVAINQKLAIAKMALHNITAAFGNDCPSIAARALEEMKVQ